MLSFLGCSAAVARLDLIERAPFPFPPPDVPSGEVRERGAWFHSHFGVVGMKLLGLGYSEALPRIQTAQVLQRPRHHHPPKLGCCSKSVSKCGILSLAGIIPSVPPCIPHGRLLSRHPALPARHAFSAHAMMPLVCGFRWHIPGRYIQCAVKQPPNPGSEIMLTTNQSHFFSEILERYCCYCCEMN